MSKFKKYFDHVAAENYIPVYAVTTTKNTTIVITERDIQEFTIEQSQIKNINHLSFFMIQKIEKEENLIKIEIELKKSKRSHISESNIESDDYWYKFETNDANNFILYLNRALYRILEPEEINSINVDECSKFVTLFPPSSSALNNGALKNNNHSNNPQTTDSIQPFYIYSRFIEKVRLSISNGNEQPIEQLVSEVSLKNLKKILKYKISKVNIFRDFPDCSKYFEILLIDIIPFSKHTTNLVFDSSINSTISNNIENYVKCLIECIEKSKNLTEITFVSELPFGIEDLFSKLSEKKEISILSITFKNVKLTKQQLSLISSLPISSFRFSGQIFDSIETLLNFIETTNIDLLSINNSPQTDFLSNMNAFSNITVLSLCKNNIEISDFFSFLSKNESKIQCLYLSGNKCEKQISNDIQIPKFEEIRLDNISWGDFFLSYFQILLKTQTFIDLSNSKMNENEWNKVFNYLNTTSDGVSQLSKLLWNGNQVNKSFFSYLRKCIDSLDSLQIVDVIDQSTEKEIFDEFISFLKEGEKLTNLFIGFSKQKPKSMSGNQLKSILSALLINMKKENSKKFYLSVPNTSSGDEGVEALIDSFNNIEDCKINFITFDGLQPKNPQKYIELCNSITKFVMKLKSIKNNSYEIQFPRNDLKCLKNQMQENDYKKLRKDFRFILVSHKLDYLHSDFLYNRMVLSPILTKKKFYVKNENDELLFFDLSSNSNLFYNSFSDSNIEKERKKKKKKEEEKTPSKDDDESFDSFFDYSDTNLNKKPDTNKSNNNNNNNEDDDDDEYTESFSEDNIEDENMKNKDKDKSTNHYKKNKANKDSNDEFCEENIENGKNRKSKEISSKNKNIKNKNERSDSNTNNQKEEESSNDGERKIKNSNQNDDNKNDESNKNSNSENDISDKIDAQKEEGSNNENDEDYENDKMDHHSSTKNLSTNGNQDQEEEINYTKTQNINQNQKSDDENNASKPIQVRNKVNNKNVADAISNNNGENTTSKIDDENESTHSISESQQNENSKTTNKSMNKNEPQNSQFNFDNEEKQSDQHESNQNPHSKNDINQNDDINNQNDNELNENKHGNGNKIHKPNQIQTKNNINNNNDEDNEYDKMDQHSSNKNLIIKNQIIYQNQKNEDKSGITGEENIKDNYSINIKKRIGDANQFNDSENENQIQETNKDKNKSISIANNKKENKKESTHLIPESQKHEHSKTTKKSTNKKASQNSQLELEYEEEEEKEQNNQQKSNQSKHSKNATKHHSSNSHSIESDYNQNRLKHHKSSSVQTRNNTNNNFNTSKNRGQEEVNESNNNRKIGIKNSKTKDKSISTKENFNSKNESDKTAKNNDKSTINGNDNLKESKHSTPKSHQRKHSKATKKSTSKNTSQKPQFEFELEYEEEDEEEEEQSDQLAIGQKRHSPDMVKLSLYYSNPKRRKRNKKGESQFPHLEIEYEEENENHKSKQSSTTNNNTDNRNDGDEFDKIYQEHFSVKSFTPNRNQGQIHRINRSSSPKQNRKNRQHHSKRIKKQGKASSLMADPLSITSLSYEHKNKSHQMKKREDDNYESDSGYDEHDSVTLVNKMTNTDKNLTPNIVKRKIYHQTQKIERIRKVDFLNGEANEDKNKHRSNCNDSLVNTQSFSASRRSSLPYKRKSLLLEDAEDKGSDIEFPEMDEITLGNREKNWAAIEEKFSLKNILHDIRANK